MVKCNAAMTTIVGGGKNDDIYTMSTSKMDHWQMSYRWDHIMMILQMMMIMAAKLQLPLRLFPLGLQLVIVGTAAVVLANLGTNDIQQFMSR